MQIGIGLSLTGGLNNANSPVVFLGSDLTAWWTTDRASLITLSGSQVTSWKDVKAGYDAAQAVSGSRPLYSATSFNGAPGVTYDGVDDELSCTDAALLAALPASNSPVEIWSIVQQDAAPADATFRCSCAYGASGSSNNARRTGRNVSGGVNRGAMSLGTGAGATQLLGTVVDFSTRHLARYVVTATGEQIAVDGNALSAETPAVGSTTNNRLRLGAGSLTSASAFWSGKLRDVLVTLPLSTDKAARMTAWGLARRML